MPVQVVRHHGRNICRLERQLVQIELDGECQIDNEEGEGEVNPLRKVGVVRELRPGPTGRGRLIQDGGVGVLKGEREGRVLGGLVLHSLFRRRRKMRRKMISKSCDSTSRDVGLQLVVY